LSGLIDEGQKEALYSYFREREEEMPWSIAQHDEARESISRRTRNSTRGGKQNE
jgi:hypothetical protein